VNEHLDDSFLYDPGKMEFEFKADLFHKNDSSFVLSYLIENRSYFKSEDNAPHTVNYKCYTAGNALRPGVKHTYQFDTIPNKILHIQKNEPLSFVADSFTVYIEVLNVKGKVLANEYILYNKGDSNYDYYFYKNTKYDFDPYLKDGESYTIFSYENKIDSYSFFHDTVSPYDTLRIFTIPTIFDTSSVIVGFYSSATFMFSKYLLSDEDFKFEKPESLAGPLKFFGETFQENDSLKFYIDKFWLQCSNFDINRSKELIRVFYNRAKSANRYFTSYKKGWDTDRGKAYVLMGLPDKIIREDGFEKWTYKSRVHNGKVVLYFKKENGCNNSNDYVARDEVNYNLMMRKAITSWKKGVIYYY